MAPISNASRLAEFGSGIGTDGAVIQVDNINKRVGIGTTNPQSTLQVGTGVSVYGNVGIVSATEVRADTLRGDGTNITGVVGVGTLNVRTETVTTSGVSTFAGVTKVTDTTETTSTSTGAVIISGGVGIAKSLRVGTELHVGGDVSIGGTLTYEDVTNIDSVGLVTARAGVNVSGGQFLVGSGVTIGNAGVATFSGTADVHLHDNVRLNIGDGSDLRLYHNGSHSFIDDQGTGNLIVRSDELRLRNTANDETYLKADNGSSVDIYYNNSKKFETTNDGTVTTGIATATGGLEINADSKYLKIGASNDIEIWHDGTDSNIRNNTGTLLLRGSSIVLKSNDAGETLATFTDDGSVELRYDNSKKFETTNDGVVITGIATATTFSGTSTKVDLNSNSDNTSFRVPFTSGNSGSVFLYADNSDGMTYNPSTGRLTATQLAGTLQTAAQANVTSLGTLTGLTVSKSVSTAYDATDDNAQRSDTATIMVENGNGTTNSFAQIVFDTADSNQSIARIVALRTGTASNDLTFVTEHSNTKAERLRITSDGKVGIGTQVPAEELEVNGDISSTNLYVTSGGDTAKNNISGGFSHGGINSKSLVIGADPNNVGANTRLQFDVDGTERLRISSSGFVGINTNNPSKYLHIVGNDGATGASPGNTDTQLVIDNKGSNGTIIEFLNDTNGTGHLAWTDTDAANRGVLAYSHSTNAMTFKTNAATLALTLDSSQNATFAGSVTDSLGNLRSIPVNSQSGAYVLVAADAGKAVYISTGGVTINNSLFSTGDAVTIINNSGSDQTITQGSGFTLYNTADASTGNRTLAGRGMATVWFSSANAGYISGAGLS